MKARYKHSVLGVAWMTNNPFLTMAELKVVLSGLFRFPSNKYALHVLSALILWKSFVQLTTAAMGELIWSSGLAGRIYLPKSAIAVGAIGTGLVYLLLIIIPCIIIASILGVPLHASIQFLPIVVFLETMFTLGIALAVSTTVVFFQHVFAGL